MPGPDRPNRKPRQRGKGLPLIRVGTSGWNYQDWKGLFYPNNVSQKDWLAYYARSFPTVEINASFYHLPAEKTVQHWYEQVPEDFVFSVKASRYITHLKHLRDPESSLNLFLQRAELLREKLGPVLFQLPPRWHPDPKRLEQFVEKLPVSHRFVFEFRNAEWYEEEIISILDERGHALCIHDHREGASFQVNASGFSYIRLHGSLVNADGCYGENEIIEWTNRLKQLERTHDDIYCYFNNDWQGFAIHNAKALLKALNQNA